MNGNDTSTTDTGHSLRVLASSKNNKWATPQEWFDYLDLEFDFTLDQVEVICSRALWRIKILVETQRIDYPPRF